MSYYIGLMSGTSLDGVDLALIDLEGQQCRLLASADYPIPDTLKAQLKSLAHGEARDLFFVGQVDHQLGLLYADCVLQFLAAQNIDAASISAIGCHGQTLCHAPNGEYPFTMQLGDANLIAAKTNITTVADFRRIDMALGGQGAPLVPAFHHYLLEDPQQVTVVLNIGGIANISVLRAGHSVQGYDTGPGNLLLDAWINKHQGLNYDAAGGWASQGKVHQALLKHLLADPYFAKAGPKSTGREYFNLSWLEQQLKMTHLSEQVLAVDVQATLLELTAITIADQVLQFETTSSPQLLVCGGGVHNQSLMLKLQQLLNSWRVESTQSVGLDPDYMEAMAFAWLAQRRLANLPSSLAEVTGASRACSLGVIYPKP